MPRMAGSSTASRSFFEDATQKSGRSLGLSLDRVKNILVSEYLQIVATGRYQFPSFLSSTRWPGVTTTRVEESVSSQALRGLMDTINSQFE